MPDAAAPAVLASFPGPVRCTRGAAPLGLTLSGLSAGRAGEPTTLAFSAAAPADLPDSLPQAVVERVDATHYLIVSGTRSWRLEAAALHLHREIAASFYRALPPRPAPWRRRLFWRVVLWLAASRAGLAALRLLRR